MLKKRLITALLALVILLAVLFYLPEQLARAAIVLLVLAGAYEWGGLLRGTSLMMRFVYVGLTASLIALAAIFVSDQSWPLLVALAWWFAALVWIAVYPTDVPAWSVWLCGLLILVPAWLSLDRLYLFSPQVLLFTLAIVWFADIGAYFSGKAMGKVKLAPNVSPGKTWEGVLGGILAVMLLAYAVSYFSGVDPLMLVPLCLAASLLSIVGDLTVSLFKRAAGVKDSGSLFPGHGGLLDRMDSVAAASPVFALALAWVSAAV